MDLLDNQYLKYIHGGVISVSNFKLKVFCGIVLCAQSNHGLCGL